MGGSVTRNVFFALVPDAATRGAMARTTDALRARHALRGRWLKPARYHMTLHFLGTFPELPLQLVGAACEAAGRVRQAAFDLVLDRAGHFPGGIGWLGCAGEGPLHGLWQELRRELEASGVGMHGHAAFKPHVTVLRDAHGILPDEGIAPLAWPVREFVLIDSVPGEGSGHRPLGRWTLA